MIYAEKLRNREKSALFEILRRRGLMADQSHGLWCVKIIFLKQLPLQRDTFLLSVRRGYFLCHPVYSPNVDLPRECEPFTEFATLCVK
ncbi:hypothetical protein L596_021564 [Steinernema carpocapsae]|uniref:Uncharacterized protein n=1 Tax=Steinernema carpocapsae TaxID=34508 RepID=A0A4U5MJ54_STECR|nr:hypothetical protein L596_021564 [Steinernema carpocapsae]